VASETLPALRLTGDVRDTMLALARLEARYTILRDPRYVMVWAERADAVHADLARLRALARTEDEARQLADAAAAFKQYREAVRSEQERLVAAGTRAPAPSEPAGRALAERVEASLEALQAATYARVLQAQAEVARLVEIIQRSSDRLLRLVNQILDISRLRAGLLPLQRGPVDLDRLVTRAAEELRPQAEEARVTLDRERLGDRFTINGDEDRLVQVVVNLLANAIRFTPAGGRVVVRVVDAGSECEVQVEDTGLGIPASELPHIFESYRQ